MKRKNNQVNNLISNTWIRTRKLEDIEDWNSRNEI